MTCTSGSVGLKPFYEKSQNEGMLERRGRRARTIIIIIELRSLSREFFLSKTTTDI